jgi:hypothetical protein
MLNDLNIEMVLYHYKGRHSGLPLPKSVGVTPRGYPGYFEVKC